MLLELVIKVASASNSFYQALKNSDPTLYQLGKEYEAALDEYTNNLRTGLNEYINELTKDPLHPIAQREFGLIEEYVEEGLEWAHMEKKMVQRILYGQAQGRGDQR